jgi:ribose/xylose/arabinose/galactoside ABC-type transport system permease subunit
LKLERKIEWKREFSQNSIWLVFVVMVIFMSFASPVFMTKRNIVSVLQTESIVGILTVGVMFAILSKGIDLSPGVMVGLSSVISASLAQNAFYTDKLFPGLPDLPVIVPILAAILVGVFFGIINGALIGYTKIPAFIATLGTQLVVRALAQLYTNAYPVPNLKNEFKVLGQGNFWGIPNVVWVFFMFVAIAGFLLTQTRFGKNVYAIGGNDQAARVAGINVEKNLVLVYTWCSFCAAVGGVLLAARSGSGNSTLGLNYELDAIAAATVGGTSHTGGVCRISGVIAGILILGILKNGLLLLNVSPYIQQAVKGIIIVGAVVFDMRKNAKRV